ncbi:MAG: HTH domain-containing protein [bacterium]
MQEKQGLQLELTERQAELLAEIVRQHAVDGQPVPSNALAEQLDVSPATIRNEMAELDEKGFLYSPHTSAGRIPTVKAYQYYIANQLRHKELPVREQEALNNVERQIRRLSPEQQVKSLAKTVSALSHLAAVTTLGHGRWYYTGISDLFIQPEFHSFEIIQSFAEILDSLDQVLADLSQQCGQQAVEIRLGSDNPFGRYCGLVVTGYGNGEVLGLLGPVRMNYDLNVSRLEAVRNILNRLEV